MNHEQLLRDTLAARAGEASVDVTLDDIRHGANRRRSRSRRRALVVLAAAAAVAVGIPAAILLRPAGDEVSPTPSPSPSPTATSSASPWPEGLDGITRGKDPQVAYLHGHQVHQPDGTTTRLPDGSSFVAAFTPYHGGWLLLDDVGGLREYDNAGALVLRSTTGEAALAVSGDQMRTAFVYGGHLHVGIATGMGQGETDLPVGSARLVGFLGDSVVLNGYPDSPHVVDPATGRSTLVRGLESVWATAAGGDLVGGTIAGDQHGRVVSASSGKTLWTGDWVPEAFSPDGSHVVAVPVSSLNEPDTVAILDARSGAVVSQLHLAGRELAQNEKAVWEPDGNAVLLGVRETQGAQQAVLRLDLRGTVTLATDPALSNDETPAWIFATQP
jgi:hypothetical protein